MILGDAQEYTAVGNPAFLSVNQTSLVQVLLKYTARNVKIYTILGPSTKAVSLKLLGVSSIECYIAWFGIWLVLFPQWLTFHILTIAVFWNESSILNPMIYGCVPCYAHFLTATIVAVFQIPQLAPQFLFAHGAWVMHCIMFKSSTGD